MPLTRGKQKSHVKVKQNMKVDHKRRYQLTKRSFANSDPELGKQYDPTKSLRQNLEATNMKELYSSRLPAPEDIPKQAKHLPKVNEEEVPICKKMIEKHGEDYEAMFWDHKMNIYQWTAHTCKKKVEAFKAGKIRTINAEIMAGHGLDMRKPLFGEAKERNVWGH
mmetsp:Transcript_53863/g.128284  ORF Transcript_53863/g.128284 Transcript_53863/m.128284 type:complete len:165 (+) Transcript_53863:87-581(+)